MFVGIYACLHVRMHVFAVVYVCVSFQRKVPGADDVVPITPIQDEAAPFHYKSAPQHDMQALHQPRRPTLQAIQVQSVASVPYVPATPYVGDADTSALEDYITSAVSTMCKVCSILSLPMIPYVFFLWHGPKACAKRTGAAASEARERQARHLSVRIRTESHEKS